MNIFRMSNSLDPDQARRIVGPDLGPNCLPRLSADDTGRQGVNTRTRGGMYFRFMFIVLGFANIYVAICKQIYGL